MKEYAVNITLNGEVKIYAFEEAYAAAQEAMADPETAEVDIMDCEDGDFGDLDLNLIREGGKVNEYRNGELCWL